MWILDNEGEALHNKRLWLRPGKRYLFGRTDIKGADPKTVSRQQIAIQIDPLAEGAGQNVSSRSKVSIENVGKLSSMANEEKLGQGDSYSLTNDRTEIRMGKYPAKFYITWHPVVLSYSFTATDMLANPVGKLRDQGLEQLDVKFLSTYDIHSTTHAVSRRRNTAKGLQALINGKPIVNDTFVDAIIEAAESREVAGVKTSSLEQDFDANWPDATRHLPPPGTEPNPRPDELFAPDRRRADMFHGYTFIFYDAGQYGQLLDVITNAHGKSLLRQVIPTETEIDDFIRFVKEVAGEKGLGGFEDGSEGKGVVVVKYLPNRHQHLDWLIKFYTDVALRLDHRLVGQKDFLDAILCSDASVLRRPLDVETQPPQQQATAMEVDAGDATTSTTQPRAHRRRVRGTVKSRFKGFTVDDSDDDDDGPSGSLPADKADAVTQDAAEDEVAREPSPEESLFVSQAVGGDHRADNTADAGGRSHNKRPAPTDDIMHDFAPTAAQVKRRRIEAGEDPIPQRKPTPPAPGTQGAGPVDAQSQSESQAKAKSQLGKGAARERIDSQILSLAGQRRDEAQAHALAEREGLAEAPADIDLCQIGRLALTVPMEVRPRRRPLDRDRDRDGHGDGDGAADRWDPVWNGRRNFKRFRQRGAAVPARPPQRIIVPLELAKSKTNGMGDEFWLTSETSRAKATGRAGAGDGAGDGAGRKSQPPSQRETQTQTLRASAGRSSDRVDSSRARETENPTRRSATASRTLDSDAENNVDPMVGVDSDSVMGDDAIAPAPQKPAAKTKSKTAVPLQTKATQPPPETQPPRATAARSTRATRATKRPGGESPAGRRRSKRAKVAVGGSDDDNDDSNDELRFKFVKR